MREEWAQQAKKDEEFDKAIAEMTKRNDEFIRENKSRLSEILAKAEAQKRRELEMLAKYPEIQEKVKRMVSGGILEEEALSACVAQKDEDMIRIRTAELVKSGIPRLQAGKMAQNEIQNQI
jgi:hypothetical protein